MHWIGERPRRTRGPQTRWQRVAHWLDDSPAKKIVVAAAAVSAFVLSVFNTALTTYRDYRHAQLKPVIEIGARTSYPLRAAVSIDQIFGHAFPDSNGVLNPAPKIDIPYYPVVLSIHNPTDKRSSLSNCVLRIRFYEREEIFESMGYMASESLQTLHETPIAVVDSGTTLRVEWLFFFLEIPALEALLHDKSTQAFRFHATCRDETNREIASSWR